MKSSKYVPLLVIGSVIALTGCEPDQEREVKQQTYNSLNDCKQDWSEDQCTPNSTFTSASGTYIGPRYYWDRGINRPIAIANDGTRTQLSNSHITSEYEGTGRSFTAGSVRTGGFGATAEGFSGGG